MQWVERLEDLADCDLLIEALPDDLPLKQDYVARLENLVANTIPIISESTRFLASEISRQMQDNSNLIAAYFYDVEYSEEHVRAGTSWQYLVANR